jgi:ubiquinone/menaquinone biosynthesis C-methylase UbiE
MNSLHQRPKQKQGIKFLVGLFAGFSIGFFLGLMSSGANDSAPMIGSSDFVLQSNSINSLPKCSRLDKLDSVTTVSPKYGEVRMPTKAEADAFVADSGYIKHLQWSITPEVRLPGASDVADFIFNDLDIPNLSGKTTLDIGTVNGCTAFEMERRGAAKVFAMDIFGPEHFGFNKLHELLNSKVTHLQSSLYYLPEFFEDQTFDLIVYSGVIYHLRNPMTSVDAIYKVLKDGGTLVVETAAVDTPTPKALPDGDYRKKMQWIGWCKGAECNHDSTNTFFFTTDSLTSFFEDNGFQLKQIVPRPSSDNIQRIMAVFVKTPDRNIGYRNVNDDVVLPVFPCSN